jgi:hypothetical protein
MTTQEFSMLTANDTISFKEYREIFKNELSATIKKNNLYGRDEIWMEKVKPGDMVYNGYRFIEIKEPKRKKPRSRYPKDFTEYKYHVEIMRTNDTYERYFKTKQGAFNFANREKIYTDVDCIELTNIVYDAVIQRWIRSKRDFTVFVPQYIER